MLLSTERRRAALPPGGGIENLARALGLDEALEPRDVRLGDASTVLHQRERVVVDAFPGRAQRVLDGAEPILQRRAPPFQQSDPCLRWQVPEEGQSHSEPSVLGRVIVRRLLQQLEEELLSLLGYAVDVLAPGRGGARRITRHPFDGTFALEPSKRRVERAVRDAPESPE